MKKINLSILEGIASAFDMTGSYYSRSRKRTMHKIRMQTNFQKHEHPIKEATRLMHLAYNEKKKIYAQK
jgi:hypothetical protein